MEKLSNYTLALFILSTLFTVFQFYSAAQKSKKILIGLFLYMLLQMLLGLSGFFQSPSAIPPRLAFLLVPAIITIIYVFLTKGGRQFIDRLNIQKLTLLHIVRIPVEIVLYYCYVAELIPKLMTFEGFNLDIISGLTAFLIYYLVFVSKKVSVKILLIWNIVCLILLINIVSIAILSAQTPFQVFAFEQPNVAITYFPLVWLPGIIVPLVLFSHLAVIRQLMFKKES